MDALDRVLTVVETIPPGQVASYGLVGEVAGVGPRQVGAIMAMYGSGVPWWRVTNRDGELPPDLTARAVEHWKAEGTPLREGGRSVAMDAAGWRAECG